MRNARTMGIIRVLTQNQKLLTLQVKNCISAKPILGIKNKRAQSDLFVSLLKDQNEFEKEFFTKFRFSELHEHFESLSKIHFVSNEIVSDNQLAHTNLEKSLIFDFFDFSF